MTYDPRPGVTTKPTREHIVHHRESDYRREPDYGGYALVAFLVMLAILFGIWLFGGEGTDTSVTTTPGFETTFPVLTTIPTP